MALMKSCHETCEQASSTEGATKLGLDAPLRKKIQEEVLIAKCEQLYLKVIEKVEKTLEEEKASKEKGEKVEGEGKPGFAAAGA